MAELLQAAVDNDTERVKALLDDGETDLLQETYDPDQSNPHHKPHTPLQWAAWHDNAEMVKALIDAGAEMEYVSKKIPCQNDTYSLALLNKSLHVIDCLLEFDYPRSESRLEDDAIDNIGNIDLLRVFIKHGLDVNAASESYYNRGASLLNLALHRCKARTSFEFLLANGADINKIDKAGQYPITLLRQNTIQDIKYLISKGAKVNVRDNDGETALLQYLNALGYNDGEDPGGVKDIIVTLLIYGADTEIPDNKGTNIHHVAAKVPWIKALIDEYEITHKATEVFSLKCSSRNAIVRCIDDKDLIDLLPIPKSVKLFLTFGRPLETSNDVIYAKQKQMERIIRKQADDVTKQAQLIKKQADELNEIKELLKQLLATKK